MSATLKLTHKAIGAEVRRCPYDVLIDGERVGSVKMNQTMELPVEPGCHTLQVHDGRKSSSTETFDAAEGKTVAFMHRKEVLAHLSYILHRSQAGTEARCA